ncbi:class I SAM-dependent methyltransferase [Candidatus Woesearchaeota archaeon]|nr:class I SAM-dependent methyltransferase [Candidatus Woesearchaeota archaeon]
MTNQKLYDLLSRAGNPNGWIKNHQLDNFFNLPKLAKLSGKPVSQSTVLDVGCGTGELYSFLKPFEVLEYFGVDVYIPSLERARREKPMATFLNIDILQEELSLFDYVFASGSLSAKMDDNYSFLEQMISRMDKLAKKGVYFNFLTADNWSTDDLLFFYEPRIVKDICRRNSTRKILFENNHAREEGHVFLY